MKPRISKESLFNYFAGQATALQKQQIDEWAKDEQNRELFFECLAAWENQNSQFTPDVNEALKKHQQRMIHQPVRTANTVPGTEAEVRSLLSLPWIRWFIAATISLVILFSGLHFKDSILYKTYQTPFGETSTLTLSDGSRVTLNANSTLQVPRFGFGQNTREVILAGEADFSIKHTPSHQNFIVQTNKKFEVVVLGTEFMVNTREHGQKVVLNKGKVQLRYQEGETAKQLTMKPGHLVTFDPAGHASVKQVANSRDFVSWKEHRFVFEQTTLAELSTLFLENYGLQLQFPDKDLMQWTVSGAFTANSAEELIETLTSASDLTYQRQGSSLIITQQH
ncbi:FecR family protein [Spirosoma validum]|uniref:FecR domain-containing protein n=1 Tax=Spirosoma validum TaxID=2771355 RepID=A0A927AWX4_9BACT|nr:FecR domain-containing protein [Spirosoma validum]MBD2751260.1 FecR domain-containing protein [Spirosoma validum]